MPETRFIPTAQIVEPTAPVRASMDEGKLEDLMGSIRSIGLLQALIVVPIPGSSNAEPTPSDPTGDTCTHPDHFKYRIVAGHRRFIACRALHMPTIECKVYPTEWDAEVAAKIAENAFREDVTAAEEGWFYCELVEKGQLTEAELCAKVRQKPEYIYARMDLVRKDGNLAKLVAERKINFTVAKELLRCSDQSHRNYLADMAAQSGCSGTVAKMWVEQWKATQQSALPATPGTAPTDAGTPPHENTIKCWCCGGEKDPQNLRMIYLHWYELESLAKILREAGLRPGEMPTEPVKA